MGVRYKSSVSPPPWLPFAVTVARPMGSVGGFEDRPAWGVPCLRLGFTGFGLSGVLACAGWALASPSPCTFPHLLEPRRNTLAAWDS